MLWGTQMVQRGFTRSYGHNLQNIIAKTTTGRLQSFFSGFFVTGVLQSSTATIVILTSFAQKNLVPLAAALAVTIGADVSTTMVVQILGFDLSWLSPVLITLGVVQYKFNHDHSGARKHLSFVWIGLGLILLSLMLIRDATLPIQHAPLLETILEALSQDPALAIVLSAIITFLIHSSLASVLLFASIASTGIIDLHLGILFVLGANIGGALIPLVVTWGDGMTARQITMTNLMMRLLTALMVSPFILHVPMAFEALSGDVSRLLIHAHTGFNLTLAVMFLPFTPVLAHLATRYLPLKTEGDEEAVRPLYLDKQDLHTPVMALSNAARESLHMSEIVQDMLDKSIKAFEGGDKTALIQSIRKQDDDVDVLYRAIKMYVSRLSQDGLDPKDADRIIQILTYATNLEHIGDILDKSLMELARKKGQNQNTFSDEGLSEIKRFHAQVMKNFQLAQVIFMSEDKALAQKMIDEKHAIRNAAEKSAEKHFTRIGAGVSETLATSSLHLDVIRDYRQINSYATRLAFTVLEA